MLMVRTPLIARPALALAMALAAVSGAVAVTAPARAADKPPKPPEAPKLKFSKPFQAVAAPVGKALDDAAKRPDVLAGRQAVQNARNAMAAASGATAKAQTKAAHDAAMAALANLLSPEKAKVEAVFAAATTPDERYYAGQLGDFLGRLSLDSAMQRKGVLAMLESGKVAPDAIGKMHYTLGTLANDARDFATARTEYATAIAAGYREDDVQAMLANAYLVDGQVPQGLELLRKAITDQQAAGRPVPANWYRVGLGAAYKAKLQDDAVWFSSGLVENFPNPENWSGAIFIMRSITSFGPQETLDAMRLVHRTNSFMEERDYVDYIEAADGRRSPGEVLKIIKLGVAAGKLKLDDVFVGEQKKAADGRLAADQASLPTFDRDARSASATATTVMAAADAFLGYDQPAKAAELYQIALGKPGVDTGRALTRLGIAQVDLNQLAEAQATFGKVTGPRKQLAQMWSLYARIKGKPSTP